jgi:hypothetical protein
MYKTNLFNQTSTSSADFSTGYQWIGLPDSVWLAVCNQLQAAVNMAYPVDTYPRDLFDVNVYCDSASNIDNLITMSSLAANVVYNWTFTVSMLDSTGTS